MPKQPGKLRGKSSREVADLLRQHGFVRERPGPHERWVKSSGGMAVVVIVPGGREAIKPKTLSSILEQAGITKAEARRFWSSSRRQT